MNLLSFFRSKPSRPHAIVRHVAATKAESRLVQRKRADVHAELAVYVATTSLEQRRADAAAFFARGVGR